MPAVCCAQCMWLSVTPSLLELALANSVIEPVTDQQKHGLCCWPRSCNFHCYSLRALEQSRTARRTTWILCSWVPCQILQSSLLLASEVSYCIHASSMHALAYMPVSMCSSACQNVPSKRFVTSKVVVHDIAHKLCCSAALHVCEHRCCGTVCVRLHSYTLMRTACCTPARCRQRCGLYRYRQSVWLYNGGHWLQV
jgi:hypothetical protein